MDLVYVILNPPKSIETLRFEFNGVSSVCACMQCHHSCIYCKAMSHVLALGELNFYNKKNCLKCREQPNKFHVKIEMVLQVHSIRLNMVGTVKSH